MKLLYCIPSLYNPGGMERVLTRKVNYLAATGRYAITIITIEQGGRPVYFPLDKSIQVVDLDVDFKSHFDHHFLAKLGAHYWKIKRYKKRLTDYLLSHPVDICISMCGKEIAFLGEIDVSCVKMAEIHFARDFRKQFLVAGNKEKIWKQIGNARTWQLERDIGKLSWLVVLTQADKAAWKSMKGRITQIYNPVEAVVERRPVVVQKKIIAVGRLEPQKGFHYLIEAWQHVAAKHPDWVLHIWGDGNLRNELDCMICERGLEKQIQLKGTTSNITDEYLTSYANVVSSVYEGLSMNLLEAMTCRLPLVSFDCPCGPGELVREGANGFLVPVGDTEALAERLCRLIESPELREEMAAASLRYSEMYHTEVIMQQWMSLFDALLDSHK